MSTVAETAAKYRVKRQKKPSTPLAFLHGNRIIQPMAANGVAFCVGLGDWETYLRLNGALEGRGFRVRYFEGLIELTSVRINASATTAAKHPAKRHRKPVKALGSMSRSRVVQPLPAPGEAACVGLANWETYLMLEQALEGRGFRVRFFKGLIELMSISFQHESISRRLAQLVALFCEITGLDYEFWGSTTQRRAGMASAEPDESFSFGMEPGEQPELVIEVGLTSGGIDKLEFWGELGAKEVWIWQNDRLHGFTLGKDLCYSPIITSVSVPGLKLALIEEFAKVTPTSKAVRAFREKLMAEKPE